MVNITTVLKKKSGTQGEYYQYYVTIPLRIAKELKLEGRNIHWKVRKYKGKKRLEIKII